MDNDRGEFVIMLDDERGGGVAEEAIDLWATSKQIAKCIETRIEE